MNTITGGLLARLEGFAIDKPGVPLPFTARLARENGWTHAFAGRVVREYKRFLYLSAAAGHPVTPSEAVDQAWHLHMVYTRSYWDQLCGEILGRPLHHDPTQGGAAEGEKFHDWYTRTLESYRVHFGEEPPADLWPAAEQRFAHSGRQQWVDRARALVIPLPFRLPRFKIALPFVLMAAVGAASLFIPSCTRRGDSMLPLDWTGGAFLLLYAVLYVLAIVWARRIKARRLSAFERGQAPEQLTDPCEIAFLSGGGKRVMESAISRLTAAGALEIVKTRWLKKVKLRATGSRPDPLHPIEEGILETARNTEGVEMRQLMGSTPSNLKAIEARLAAKGLKPTAAERGMAGFSSMLPFLLLIAFGAGKVFVGAYRDRPVGFLIAFLIVTFITAIVIAARSKYLTTAGESTLKSHRAHWHGLGTPRTTPDEIGTSVALFGVSMLTGMAGMDILQRELRNANPAAAAQANNSGGGGCGSSGCSSSGCGSSGCGSSGCGGCGGGD
jgi:uncharacterized protein (TIGR04222 family)